MRENIADAAQRNIMIWLFACCLLVFAMVVVGGATRLTQSGLSIVEWQPIVGTIPPLSQNDWEILFEKYRQTPEYRQVNKGMSLSEFKGIFWWEYFHRLLGRAIGLAFLVPFVWFFARGEIRGALRWQLGGIFALGALQGAMGWYMVKSGLVDNPRVSHLRLAAHFGLALVIYGWMLWVALDLLRPARAAGSGALLRLSRYAGSLAVLIFVMGLSGALVAGIRAGFAYNTFPLMNGHFLPPGMLMLDPSWLNFFNNMTTVQFTHRMIAWLLIALVAGFWMAAQRVGMPRGARIAVHALAAALAIQIALGVATLLLVVPVPLAVAHQGGAVLLLSAAVWAMHELRAAAAFVRVTEPALRSQTGEHAAQIV